MLPDTEAMGVGYEEPSSENRKLAQSNWLVVGPITIIEVFGKYLLVKSMVGHAKYNEVDVFEPPVMFWPSLNGDVESNAILRN